MGDPSAAEAAEAALLVAEAAEAYEEEGERAAAAEGEGASGRCTIRTTLAHREGAAGERCLVFLPSS